MPAKQDITPISGYITYPIAVREGYIEISSIQDTEDERDEVFTVRLLAAKSGATLSATDYLSTLTGKLALQFVLNSSIDTTKIPL